MNMDTVIEDHLLEVIERMEGNLEHIEDVLGQIVNSNRVSVMKPLLHELLKYVAGLNLEIRGSYDEDTK